MFRRVEIRMTIPADDRPPLLVWEFKSIFAINVPPAVKLGRLGVENETVEIKYQGFYHTQILTHAIL